jgi:hypothetical protein
MRSLALRSVIAVPLAALTIVSLSACQPATAATASPIHCNVMLDPPRRDDDKAPKRIVSQVRFWCENPGADTISLTLRMQKKNSHGRWVDVATTSFTARGRQTVRTDAERYRTRTVSVSCSSGDFRTMVAGRSTGRSKTTTYNLTGSPSAQPCQPTIFFS